ncbi:MAG: NAD(P)-dependent oxidoreductase [Planctomycetota bacterium]
MTNANPTAPRVLVTGGTGCIGSSTVRWLIDLGAAEVIATSRAAQPGSLPLWFESWPQPRVRVAALDLADGAAIDRLMREHAPTHVVHLAAFQTPDCEANPLGGMDVNVGGTLRLLEAARRAEPRVHRFVFASSAAVYGLRSRYPGPTVRESDPLAPVNLYGVWKLASEELVRLFHERHGLDAISLRLNTTYGKGRDRGATSGVTRAMKCIAVGAAHGKSIPLRMAYGGRENYHFAGDVGAAFARAALDPFRGHAAFNLRGCTVPVAEFLQRIASAAEALGMAAHVDLGIQDGARDNPFVCDLDETAILRAFPSMPRTALEDGVRRSLQDFAAMARAGSLTVDGN